MATFDGLKKQTVFLFLFLLLQHAGAQRMLFSNMQGLNSKTYYNKVIGENDGGIYLLRFKNSNLDKHVTIERYSHALSYIDNQTYYLQKNEKLLKCFTTRQGLNLITLQKKRKNYSLVFASLDYSLKSLQGRTEIFNTEKYENNDGSINIDYTPDRSHVAIWIAETGKNLNQSFSFVFAETSGKAEYIFSKDLPFNSRYCEIVDMSCSPGGKCAVLLHVENISENDKSPASHAYYLMTGDRNGIGEPELLNHNFFINDLSIAYNEVKNKFDVVGFYDFKSGKSCQGIFRVSNQEDVDTLTEIEFSKFNDEIITKVIGAKAFERGDEMENFKFRKMIPRSDGGVLLIAEKFFISQQFETFYFNGIPQTSAKNIYNYDDLLIMSVDSSGKLEWVHAEYKKQNAFSQGAYYLSVGVYAFEDKVYLIYNDNLSQNNRVLMLTLSKEGVLKQNIILKSEEEPTYVIPFEGRQVGYNSFVLPVLHDNELSLMKIIE